MPHPTRIFNTPDDMLEAWRGYVQWLEDVEKKRWPKVQYVGRDGVRVEDYPKIPYTLEGFKRYCYAERGNVEQYFYNKDGLYDDFVGICAQIREWIREDQIVGGLLGNYNPSITQRLNGLTEKSEVTVKEQPLFGDNG